jgi:hypothetical protein
MPRAIQLVDFDGPRRLRWRQEDANAVFDITYVIEPTAAGGRFTQRDVITWKVPRLFGRMAERLFVDRHIGEQMTELKVLLERG